MILERKEGETEIQYLWRVGKLVESGQVGSWKEITPILNKQLREDDEYYDESAYRKKYQAAKKFYDEIFSQQGCEDFKKEQEELLREIKKEKVKLRDERTESNRGIRIEARVEDKLDYLEDIISKQGKVDYKPLKPEERKAIQIKSDNDLVVMLSDLHIGQTFHSAWGHYDLEIAKDRMNQYLNKIIEIKDRHHSENCFVTLQGDMISNSIHKTIAITNRENVIEQVIEASEMVTAFLAELSKYFNNVTVASVVGNHSRIDKKEDALKDERLDTLIEWYAKKKLEDFDNIKFVEAFDNTFTSFVVRDKHYFVVHGDYDTMNQGGLAKLSMMAGYFPYCVLFGHRHFPATTEINGIKLVQSGSLPGSGDDHTIELRLSGKPSQTVLVCSENGIECNYTVELV
ncbi:metallophosphoesterase [bacterium]|nr:metallophosphoesterase [bacterium]